LLILIDSTVEILHEKTNPSTAAKRLDDFFDSTLESLQRKPFRSLWSNVGIFLKTRAMIFITCPLIQYPYNKKNKIDLQTYIKTISYHSIIPSKGREAPASSIDKAKVRREDGSPGAPGARLRSN
jgi:hypothetical protein